ncbi:MAG TPA: orotidine-5'-phosphate decarboxylase [Pyrinomonadaceae bacterium]|nr:orotidine-5'-phosphate decarboxylase [Pyrinomonadaceae bacterium]
MSTRNKLIVALDVSPDDALKLVRELTGVVSTFKVGSQLFTQMGPKIVEEILSTGSEVFLDLKFHDIPHQVAGAASSATGLGVSMFTIHASGGSEMMRRAVESVKETAAQKQVKAPAVIAVSVLTSMDAAALADVGFSGTPEKNVLGLVKLAVASAVDGVVASPREAEAIRSAFPGQSLKIVTPGIRLEESETRDSEFKADDQKRIATPSMALAAGADFLVVGRPITGAPKPAEAAQAIIAEMEEQ